MSNNLSDTTARASVSGSIAAAVTAGSIAAAVTADSSLPCWNGPRVGPGFDSPSSIDLQSRAGASMT